MEGSEGQGNMGERLAAEGVKGMGAGQDAGSAGAEGSPGSVTAGLPLAGHSMGHGRS